MAQFSLPPYVTCEKQMIEGRMAYVFRHNYLGQLGRLVVTGTPSGETHLACEVAGEEGDPKTAERQAILEPITAAMTAELESKMGIGRKPDNDPSPLKSVRTVVETKLIPCETCGKNAAMLVFTGDEATTESNFADYERQMYRQMSDLNVATWIIGPPVGELREAATDTLIQKVWPKREALTISTADQFNEELDSFLESHC